jgi:hypothetical protein
MPDTNDRVMAMIEKEIQANPDISNDDLRSKAEKLDDAVARMSARQFNATYPLQVKRRLRPRRRGGRKAAKAAKRGRKAGSAGSGGRKRGRPPKASAGVARGGGRDASARDRVRTVLVAFASDLASADGAGLVRVIAGVDGYVERVMKATGR